MRFVPALAVLLALVSAVSIAIGAGLLSPGGGLIVAGLEGLAAAWAGLYAYRQSAPPPPPPTSGRRLR